MRNQPFVATHKLKHDIPQLKLKAGTLLRQINPFAGDRPLDHLWCLDEDDWTHCRLPWIFLPSHVESLDNWPEERQKMIDNICGDRKNA